MSAQASRVGRDKTRRGRRAWPLWTWAAGVAVVIGAIVTGGCATGLIVADRFSVAAAALCLGLGGLGTAVAATAAAVAAESAATALRVMRDDTLRRLRDGESSPRHQTSRGLRRSAEMSELDAVVDALALRMRVADELAARSVSTAQQTSAGMYELLSGAIVADEAARGQLAAELHDTVAQSVALARMQLAEGAVDRAADSLQEAEDQVRALMARTRPPGLRDGDLADAVAGLRDEMHQRYGLRVATRWPDVARPIPLATAVTIYRFFQESLLNVVKHADVDDALLELDFDGDRIVAAVADRGPGFDLASVRPERGRHVGLGLLRERIRIAGGTLEVDARSGEGTRLTITVPLPLRAPAGGDTARTGSAVSRPVRDETAPTATNHRDDSAGHPVRARAEAGGR